MLMLGDVKLGQVSTGVVSHLLFKWLPLPSKIDNKTDTNYHIYVATCTRLLWFRLSSCGDIWRGYGEAGDRARGVNP